MNGKGSARRRMLVSWDDYSKNWDRIFSPIQKDEADNLIDQWMDVIDGDLYEGTLTSPEQTENAK